ncbi:MAG: 50S ribosomal protein L31 [Parcubacteria group bacterium]|nr:50S ribosomal protein L31 [Parcubacteria group bacterium]
MKTDLHPTYNKQATFKCACGSEFKVGSTLENFETELCNNCHPFYTGKQKIVDTARRLEKFEKKMAGKSESLVSKKEKKAKVRAKKAATSGSRPSESEEPDTKKSAKSETEKK